MSELVDLKLYDYIKKIQSSSKKLEKKEILDNLLFNYLELKENFLEKDIDLIFIGDNKEIKGLIQLSGIMNIKGNFKESSKTIFKLIYKLISSGDKKMYFAEKISVYDDIICNSMKLNDYFKLNSEFKQIVIDFILIIKKIRSSLNIEEFGIKPSMVEEIKKEIFARDKIIKKIEEEKLEEIKKKIADKLNYEPCTWAEVENLPNRYLINIDFIGNDLNVIKNSFSEEEKEKELLDNFVDPLSNNLKNIIHFSKFKEEIHINCQKFKPEFFLEEICYETDYNEFIKKIKYLEENILNTNSKEINSLDRNLCKYLECKKIIDSLINNFNKNISSIIKQGNLDLKTLEKDISFFLMPLKASFEKILNAKSSKDFLIKFENFFIMKDKIENFLKMSSFDQLAEYLKKSISNIHRISQTKEFDKDFYNYFIESYNKLKILIGNIIISSNSSDEILTYFKYLLEFEIDIKKIEDIIEILKKEFTIKLENFLKLEMNTNISKYKMLFKDDFQICYQPEFFFSKISINIHDIDFTKIIDVNLVINNNDDSKDNNSDNLRKINKSFLKLNRTSNDKDYSKEKQIDIEVVLNNLNNELKEFLYVMRTIDQNLKLKKQNFNLEIKFSLQYLMIDIYNFLLNKMTVYFFEEDFTFAIRDQITNHINLKLSNDNIEKNNYFNNLIEFYNIKDNNLIFREIFEDHSLMSLSSSILNIFFIFEVYFPKENINLNNNINNKLILIEKIYLAISNHKIQRFLKYLNDDNTIDFFEQHYSIHNSICFEYVKNSLQILYKDYNELIVFFIKIKSKLLNSKINPLNIIINFFESSKFLIINIYNFYETESKITTNTIERLNLLILEILKNINYMKTEIYIISRMLFKNKENDYIEYYAKFQAFCDEIKKLLIDKFLVKNISDNLFGLMFSGLFNILKFENKSFMESFSSEIDIKKNYYISQNETYEKISNIIILGNTNFLLQNYRSNLTSILFVISNIINEIIFVEIKSIGSMENKSLIYNIINQSLKRFFILSNLYIQSEKDKFISNLLISQIFQLIVEFEILGNKFNIQSAKILEIQIEFEKIIESLNEVLKKIKDGKESKLILNDNDKISKLTLINNFEKKYSNYFSNLNLILLSDNCSKQKKVEIKEEINKTKKEKIIENKKISTYNIIPVLEDLIEENNDN